MTPGADRDNQGERPPGRAEGADLEARRAPLRRPDFWHQVAWAMSDGLAMVDHDRVIIDVNPAFCALFGFGREEIIGFSPPYPFWPPENRAEIELAFEKTLRGEGVPTELVFRR